MGISRVVPTMQKSTDVPLVFKSMGGFGHHRLSFHPSPIFTKIQGDSLVHKRVNMQSIGRTVTPLFVQQKRDLCSALFVAGAWLRMMNNIESPRKIEKILYYDIGTLMMIASPFIDC